MKGKRTRKGLLCITLSAVCLGMVACRSAPFDENKNVTVVTREDGSGTKSAFMEILGLKGKRDVSGVIVATTTVAALQEVKSNPHAIAYDSLGYVTDEVKILKVDGVAATAETVKNGSYKISRPLSLVYKEDPDDRLKTAFLEFLHSSDAGKLIGDGGYFTVGEHSEAYEVKQGLSGRVDVSGSTSLKPLIEEWLAPAFERLQTGVSVTVAGGGSGQGYNDAKNGVSDFGMISETFAPEKAQGCVCLELAKDGIAVIVNRSNPLEDISLADLKDVYDRDAGANAIKKWAQVGK